MVGKKCLNETLSDYKKEGFLNTDENTSYVFQIHLYHFYQWLQIPDNVKNHYPCFPAKLESQVILKK